MISHATVEHTITVRTVLVLLSWTCYCLRRVPARGVGGYDVDFASGVDVTYELGRNERNGIILVSYVGEVAVELYRTA